MIKYIVLIVLVALGAWWYRSHTSNIVEPAPDPVIIQEDITLVMSPQEPHPHSLPVLMEKDFRGNNFSVGKILAQNESYTRYFITYTSEGFTISGIMNVPIGEGPFPVLILNHGYIDPAYYTNGQGLKREQDYFARRGYVVVHSDYRDHAQSDTDPMNDIKPRTGYTEDVINAIVSLKNANLSYADTDRIGMLGHSMGGGVTLNVMVVKPELVDAYILLAPINAEYKENFDRWVAPEMDDIAKRTMEYYGSFDENPKFWNTVSAINYFDRIQGPIQLHQGTADEDVPVEWSRRLDQDLKKANKEITYYEYENATHTFIANQSLVMQRSVDLFDTYVKGQ